MTSSLHLPFDGDAPGPARLEDGSPHEPAAIARDRAARARAVDPRYNVVLEASAGTGKTRVLVDRYVNLLRAGVDPGNVLAITFTRKAAAEMRERIVSTLRTAAERGEIAPSRWRDLRDRLGDIAISTIDAFCLGLLREFPLEADLDPGFAMADDTEVPLLVDEALDRALRVCRSAARDDERVALALGRLGVRRARAGLAALLNRRLVAPAAISRYLARAPRDLSIATAARRGGTALLDVFAAMPGGLDRFLETGPPAPAFLVIGRTIRALEAALRGADSPEPAIVQTACSRVRDHFLTLEGQPRARPPYPKAAFASEADWRAHRDLVAAHASAVADALAGYRRDVDVLVVRGVWRMYRIAEAEYRRTLDAHAVLDFPDVLARTLDVLRHMEEFAQSRYRLESRYHHVLVDEFQDTSRAQWELVSLLIQSWGEGAGLAHTGPLAPSVFIVGDRKQSIYRFRDADVSVLRDATAHLERLRPEGDVRRSIARSFRSRPALLAFVNDVCHEMGAPAGSGGAAVRPDAFQYGDDDRFPVDQAGEDAGTASEADALGLVSAASAAACAGIVAAEIARLVETGAAVRDRATGLPRAMRPGDVGILFRTRESHRVFEDALERRGIPAYVYKGLGFFDADEVRDVLALVGYLADPASDLRAAAWMRSRFVRLSDDALRILAPRLAEALLAASVPEAAARLDALDARVLAAARTAAARWLRLADRMPPAELIDAIVADAAYPIEMRGARAPQARENLKKLRTLVRRIQNRGYVTLPRLAARLDRLAVGDDANAVIDAADAVNLMTIHAAKGLEFPVVFVVNLARGAGGARDAVRLTHAGTADVEVSVAGDGDAPADEDTTAADREETKRLLYVALTRARDRLYLGAVRRDGRLHAARGSLAEVLPSGLLDLLGDSANAASGTVLWQAASGARHAFRVCGEGDAAADRSVPGHSIPLAPMPAAAGTDFGVLRDEARPWRAASAAVLVQSGARSETREPPSDRLIGTLVHRLIHRVGMVGDPTDDALKQRLAAMLRYDEAAELDDRAARFDDAVAMYREIVRRPDVRALYEGGELLHEVPFAIWTGTEGIRGTIDCLIRRAEGIVVLEFKTGRPRPEHRTQVETYAQAVRQIFPGARVEARLVYASAVAET